MRPIRACPFAHDEAPSASTIHYDLRIPQSAPTPTPHFALRFCARLRKRASSRDWRLHARLRLRVSVPRRQCRPARLWSAPDMLPLAYWSLTAARDDLLGPSEQGANSFDWRWPHGETVLLRANTERPAPIGDGLAASSAARQAAPAWFGVCACVRTFDDGCVVRRARNSGKPTDTNAEDGVFRYRSRVLPSHAMS